MMMMMMMMMIHDNDNDNKIAEVSAIREGGVCVCVLGGGGILPCMTILGCAT